MKQKNRQKNPAAVALGRLGLGKKKKLTKAELQRRTKRIRANQWKRWAKKGKRTPQKPST